MKIQPTRNYASINIHLITDTSTRTTERHIKSGKYMFYVDWAIRVSETISLDYCSVCRTLKDCV